MAVRRKQVTYNIYFDCIVNSVKGKKTFIKVTNMKYVTALFYRKIFKIHFDKKIQINFHLIK